MNPHGFLGLERTAPSADQRNSAPPHHRAQRDCRPKLTISSSSIPRIYWQPISTHERISQPCPHGWFRGPWPREKEFDPNAPLRLRNL